MCAGFTTAIAGAAIGQAGGPLDGLGHGAVLDSEHAHNFPAPRDALGRASECGVGARRGSGNLRRDVGSLDHGIDNLNRAATHEHRHFGKEIGRGA